MKKENMDHPTNPSEVMPHDQLAETPSPESSTKDVTPSPRKKIVLNKKTIVSALIVLVIIGLGALIYRSRGLFIAATVDGAPISRWSVVKELEKASGKNTLDALINRHLVETEALKKNVTVSQETIDGELKTIEDQLKTQGQTLDEALKAENMTRADLEKQIVTQKKLESLLADKTGVTDDEVTQYLKDSGVKIPEGQEAAYQEQARNQLKQQKLSSAAAAFIDGLRTSAQIKYFVTY